MRPWHIEADGGRTGRYTEPPQRLFGNRFIYFRRSQPALAITPMLPVLTGSSVCVCTKPSSEPRRHNSRLEDPQHKMFGNVIRCLKAQKNQRSEKLPRGLTSDLLDGGLMVDDSIKNKTPDGIFSVGGEIQTTHLRYDTWHLVFRHHCFGTFAFSWTETIFPLQTDWLAGLMSKQTNNPALNIIIHVHCVQILEQQLLSKTCYIRKLEKHAYDQRFNLICLRLSFQFWTLKEQSLYISFWVIIYYY